MSRSAFNYQNKPGDDDNLRKRLRELAQEKRRYGCNRLHVLLRKEGLVINHKKTERLYRLENLSLRKKRRKKLVASMRIELPKPEKVNQIWGIDFAGDQLDNGRRFRSLCVIDQFSRECPAIKADTSIPGVVVVKLLDYLKEVRGLPKIIVCDNGPEFTSRVFWEWAERNNVKISYIRPGKPIENAYTESFIGKFRDECLNENVFRNLQDARDKIERYRNDYNHNRPHRALQMLSPMEFLRKEDLKEAA